jgi:hypothetical protein
MRGHDSTLASVPWRISEAAPSPTGSARTLVVEVREVVRRVYGGLVEDGVGFAGRGGRGPEGRRRDGPVPVVQRPVRVLGLGSAPQGPPSQRGQDGDVLGLHAGSGGGGGGRAAGIPMADRPLAVSMLSGGLRDHRRRHLIGAGGETRRGRGCVKLQSTGGWHVHTLASARTRFQLHTAVAGRANTAARPSSFLSL